MKRPIAIFTVTCLLFTACQKDEAPKKLTRDEIRHKVDSIVTIRNKELEQASQIDLKHRLRIEVKAKADSIFNASLQKETRKDSLAATHKKQ